MLASRDGAWHTLPAGFSEVPIAGSEDGDRERAQLRRDMRATRREEGFADLVGLAWTLSNVPQQYQTVHAWLEQRRAQQAFPVAITTRASGLRWRTDRAAFDTRAAGPFEQARVFWQAGC